MNITELKMRIKGILYPPPKNPFEEMSDTEIRDSYFSGSGAAAAASFGKYIIFRQRGMSKENAIFKALDEWVEIAS